MNWSNFKKYIQPIVSNKFFIATLIFIIYITAFDQNSLIDRYQLSKRIKQLENQKEHYIKEIDQNNRKMEELQSSDDNLEKFAREEYLMKKKDEVIFVVEEE
ncbi:septum formation initiator family protein [Carboxylicivirga sp. M1479]|uniref:FtsB family cell division protein n=1 Tax=Carboxylicivirga sp. M1479 TaxID=2594476 RepID=UPI00117881F4|nr:septum formation initiator family protein [Carboxylicivirga sp. M1479]TRX70863.1 septum formation initiator family protein [Carboxylicivirga sp. M1479]